MFSPPNLAVRFVVIEPPAHGVLDRARLLKNFLEHVMRETRRARHLRR